MDELKDTWSQLNQEARFTQLSKEEIQSSIRQESKGLLEQLTKKVLIKFWFCVSFTLILAVGIPFISHLAGQILLTILLAGYLVGSILLYQEYSYLRLSTSMDLDLRMRLISFRKRIKDVIRFEEGIGLALYPVSAAGGWFVGFTAFGHSANMDTRAWMIFIITLVVLTPIGHLVTRWLNRKAFGKMLDQLDQNIAEIQQSEL